MYSNKQILLADLKGEIDSITRKVDNKEVEWKNASVEDKPVILDSIMDLNDEKRVLIADRSRLLASIAPSSAPGDPSPSLEQKSSGPLLHPSRDSTHIAKELTDHFLGGGPVVSFSSDTKIARTSSTSSSDSSSSDFSVVRPVFQTLRYESDDTFGRAMLGALFRISIPMCCCVLSLWMVGLVAGWLAMWHFIPMSYIWLGALQFPALLFLFFCFNRTLAGLVLRQQQTILYWFWCIVYLIGQLAENKTQDHFPGVVLFLFACAVSCIILPMFDAFPLHIRGIAMKILLPSVIPVLLLIQVGLHLNWGENPPNFISFFGHLSYSSSAIASSALQNVVILTGLNAVYGFMYPSSLVMVKSRTQTITLSEEEAKVLRALDAVATEIAAVNEEEDILSTIGQRVSKRMSWGKNKILEGVAASSKVAATGE